MNKYIRYKENNKNKICLHCGAENEKGDIEISFNINEQGDYKRKVNNNK